MMGKCKDCVHYLLGGNWCTLFKDNCYPNELMACCEMKGKNPSLLLESAKQNSKKFSIKPYIAKDKNNEVWLYKTKPNENKDGYSTTDPDDMINITSLFDALSKMNNNDLHKCVLTIEI